MKYIKTFESFREPVNEEFIGNLFKNLKNKFSLGFSKMFGTASKVQKLMEEYKKEISMASSKKNESLKSLGEFIKAVKDGGENDVAKLKTIKDNLTKAEKNFEDQVKIIKQKFDLKFEDVVKEEKNPKIKSFITLQKLEMQQELLQDEMKTLLSNGELKAEEIDDPDLKKIIEELKKKTQDSQKMAEEKKKELEAKDKEEKNIAFDVEKAQEAAEKGEVYLWEDSPMKDYTFKKGDIISYYSQSNKKETLAEVLVDSPAPNKLKVKTDSSAELEINRGTVMSSEKFKEEETKKDTQTEKETEKL